MKKTVLVIFIAMLLLGCNGNKNFHVSVDIPSVGTQEVTVVYRAAGNDRVVMRLPALDGKFEFDGCSIDTTEVEIFNARKLLIASFQAVNGAKISLTADGDNILMEGMNDYFRTSFADTIVTEWPLFKAQELVISDDSVATFDPAGVWVFTSSTMERTTSVLDTIRKYAKIDSVEVRDVYVSGDMSQWRVHTRRDSATWTQGLMPDAPVALRGILLFTPCLVEADTAGSVLRVQRLE